MKAQYSYGIGWFALVPIGVTRVYQKIQKKGGFFNCIYGP